MLEKNPQLSSLAAGQRPGMPHAPLFPIKLCHVGSYHLQHHQRDAAGLRWGEIPSKPSLKQRAEQKVDSSRGKGISEQRVSQSQPPLPHSSIILAPKRAHTHTHALRRLPCARRRGHAGAQRVSGAAWCSSPALQHMEGFQRMGTPARRVSGGTHPALGTRALHDVLHPLPARLCLSYHVWRTGIHLQLPEHLSIPP